MVRFAFGFDFRLLARHILALDRRSASCADKCLEAALGLFEGILVVPLIVEMLHVAGTPDLVQHLLSG